MENKSFFRGMKKEIFNKKKDKFFCLKKKFIFPLHESRGNYIPLKGVLLFE